MREVDVLVIGGGPAGLTAAVEAAGYGLDVVLAERNRLGGTALWAGPVPLRALMSCATRAHLIRRAAGFGVRTEGVSIDFAAVRERIDTVIRAVQPQRSPEALRRAGVELVGDEATFTGSDTVTVDGEDIRGKRIIVATGARPHVPDVDGLAETGFLTYRTVWDRPTLPGRLAIVGATAAGCQFAQALGRLGCQVTLIDSIERILPQEDAEIALEVAEALRAEGVTVLLESEVVQVLRRGDEATFTGSDTVTVGGEDIRGKRIIVATGARPHVPEVDGLAETGFLTYRTVWDRPTLPGRLAIVGATAAGCQFAQALGRLGCQVTLIDSSELILPQEDAEIAEEVAEALRAEGVTVLLESEVVQVLRRGDEKAVSIEAGGERRDVEVDEVLVTTGRRPDVKGLNLAATEIETTRREVVVDRRLRTTGHRTWAVGDVNMKLGCVRAAELQARRAVRDAVLPWPVGGTRDRLPWAVGTDPAIIHVGLTEEQARQRYGDTVHVARQDLTSVDGAVCEARTRGMVKLVTDRRGHLLGAHALGPRSDEWLPVLARVARGGGVGELEAAHFAYPTASEAMLAAWKKLADDHPLSRWKRWLASRAARWYV